MIYKVNWETSEVEKMEMWKIKRLIDENKRLNNIIDKAIEYIENGELYDVDDNCINEILLDILKSSDDDDNS